MPQLPLRKTPTPSSRVDRYSRSTSKPSRGDNMRNRTLIAAAVLSLTCFASAQAGADNERKGTLQLIKSCQNYNGRPGDYCAITESNLAEIPANPGITPQTGTVVYYTQEAGIIPNVIDSNIVLDAGDGNRAVGRCTFDDGTNTGLCVYTDGTGTLAGFSARLEVTPDPPGDLNTSTYFVNGPYVFKNLNMPAS